MGLAGVGLGNGLHVFRPLPAWLKHALADRLASEIDQLGLSLALKRPGLVGRIEVLGLACHLCSFRGFRVADNLSDYTYGPQTAATSSCDIAYSVSGGFGGGGEFGPDSDRAFRP